MLNSIGIRQGDTDSRCDGNNNTVSSDVHGYLGKEKKMKVHLPQGARKYSCPPDNIKCGLCHKIIKFKRNLAKHMSDFHETTEKLCCDHCDKNFSSRFNLDRHLKSKNCLMNSTYECKNCKARFVSVEKLEVHKVKNCPKKYFCFTCLEYFKSKAKFVAHSSVHVNDE